MKKIISFVMVLSTLVLLAACGSSGDTGDKETDVSEGNVDFEDVTISIGHINPETDEAQFHKGIEKFIEIVDEKTDGAVSFEVHPAGELGGEREMIEDVQFGTLDMVVTSTGPLGNFASKTLALDFPFLFRDRDHAYKVLDGEIGDELNDEIAENDLYNLAWWETGFRHITNNKHAITEPADLKGLKIRTMENPVHLDAFKEFGASPTPMSFNELYTGLEQGVVDGQENPMTVIVPNKLYEVQDHLTLTAHVYSPGAVLINPGKFDGLSPELQKVIEDAAVEARDYERDFVKELEDDMIEVMREHDTEVTEEYDFDAFFEATQTIYEKYDDQYGEILDRILEVE